MIKYIILCVLLTIGEFKGQILISHVRGPSVITNLSSVHTNSSSVVNVINSYEEAELPSKESTGSVVQDGVSSIADDTSIGRNLYSHYNLARIFPNYDYDDDDDEDEDYKDYKNNTDEGNTDNYVLINGPLVIHGTGSAGTSVQSVQSGGDQKSPVSIVSVNNGKGQWNYHPAERTVINVGPAGIFKLTTQNKGEMKSSISVTNTDNQSEQQNFFLNGGKTISLNPAGISINKVQNGNDRKSSVSIANVHNKDGQETVNVGSAGISIKNVQNDWDRKSPISFTNLHNRGEGIRVSPSGISIHKLKNDKEPFHTNIHYGGGRDNSYPVKEETISLGPAGISIQEVQNGGDHRPTASITNIFDQIRRQNYEYDPPKAETIKVGPAGISIQKLQSGNNRRPTPFIANISNQARRQNYEYDPAKVETINVGPDGIFVQKVQNGKDWKS